MHPPFSKKHIKNTAEIKKNQIYVFRSIFSLPTVFSYSNFTQIACLLRFSISSIPRTAVQADDRACAI